MIFTNLGNFHSLSDLKKFINITNKTFLRIRDQDIGPEGAKAIAEGLVGSNLTYFDINHNPIEQEGLGAIFHILSNTMITEIPSGIFSPTKKEIIFENNKKKIIPKLGLQDLPLKPGSAHILSSFLITILESIACGAISKDVRKAIETLEDKKIFSKRLNQDEFKVQILCNALVRSKENVGNSSDDIESIINALLSADLYRPTVYVEPVDPQYVVNTLLRVGEDKAANDLLLYNAQSVTALGETLAEDLT